MSAQVVQMVMAPQVVQMVMAAQVVQMIMAAQVVQMAMVLREAMKILAMDQNTNVPRRMKQNATPHPDQCQLNIVNLEIKRSVKSWLNEYLFPAKGKTAMMRRKKFVNQNKGHSRSKLRSMSTPNNAHLSQKLFATTPIRSIWNQYAFHILGKNVATTLKKNAKTYPSNTYKIPYQVKKMVCTKEYGSDQSYSNDGRDAYNKSN